MLYENVEEPSRPISKTDMYEFGLSGHADSSARRSALLKHYNLPSRMTSNALVDVLNCITDYDTLVRDTGILFGGE